MTIKEKLEKYDLYDQSIIQHGVSDYIRDYKVIGYLCNSEFDIEVQYIFKGCVKTNFEINIKPEHFSMDDRLLFLDKQDELDFPKGFVWGARHAVVFPGWELIEDNEELRGLEKSFGLKFYQIQFKTNVYDLILIFNDLEINLIRQIEKE